MCERCEELEERIAWLEGELHLRHETSDLGAIQAAYRLSPGEAAILLSLYKARGRTMRSHVLLESLPARDHARDRDPKSVDVRICRIRRRIGRDAISTIWGHGYSISETGASAVRATLASAGGDA